MDIYSRFCDETVSPSGELLKMDFHYPENFNFGYDVVDFIADREPDKRALVWCNSDGEEHIFSFADIREMSDKIATVLSEGGIKRGDRIIVCLKRHYEYWPLAIAVHKLGATLIPVTHMLTESDFEYRFSIAKPKAVICTPNNRVPEKILRTAKGTSIKLWTVSKDISGFENLTSEMEKAKRLEGRVETKVTDPMLMYFTSGTTSSPKAVIHDFSYPLAHIVTAKYWQEAREDGLHFTLSETGWAKASWGKLYGQWLVGSAVMVYDFDNFEPKSLTHILNKYKVTSFCAPPTVYRYLVRKNLEGLPYLEHASTAGEYLSSEIFIRFKEATGLTIKEGYGQTETTLLAANFSWAESVDGSMGKASPIYPLKIVDPNGNECCADDVGEIVIEPVRGKKPLGVFSAYLNDEERYKYAWRGGVYHTGDSAWKDKEGNFWFNGRFDDIIKSGGFRVGPAEIEGVLVKHEAVMECSVIGIPDPARGQAIKAFVVLATGYAPSRELEKEIRDFCNAQLADYKWIKTVAFIDEMPKTISGKIIKAELRKR